MNQIKDFNGIKNSKIKKNRLIKYKYHFIAFQIIHYSELDKKRKPLLIIRLDLREQILSTFSLFFKFKHKGTNRTTSIINKDIILFKNKCINLSILAIFYFNTVFSI